MKNFIAHFKRNFVRSIHNDKTIIIYSVLISILTWFVISINVYPTTPKTISGVELIVDTEDTSAEINNLSVISQSIDEVIVQIQGQRTQIGNLKAEQLKAYAVIENVNDSGEYELDINVECTDKIDFDVLNISPSTVKVTFDEYITKEIPVTAKVPNVTAANGYYMDEISCSPSTVNISGPRSKVDSVSELVVNAQTTGQLDRPLTVYSEEWTLYNDLNVVEDDDITVEESSFQIDIPIYMKKELELTYTLQNVPSYLSEDAVEFELSADSITVAAVNGSLDDINTWHLGYIDLREVTPDKTFTFQIELPAGCQNLSNITTVTATLKSDELSSRSFPNLDNFSIVNKPSQYDITILTKSISPILVGKEEELENITGYDIVLEVDLSAVTIQNSEFSAPVTVIVQNYDDVWAVGSYQAVLSASEKVTETTAPPETVSTSKVSD